MAAPKREVFDSFAHRFRSDGFGDLADAASVCRRLFWLLLLVAAWTLFCIQAFFLSAKYSQFEVETKVELRFDRSAKFPSVLLCNLNPVRHTAANESGIFEGLALLNRENERLAEDGLGPRSWDEEKRNFLVDEFGEHDFMNERMPAKMKAKRLFYETFHEVDDLVKTDLGHRLENMLVECIWMGTQCTPSDFAQVRHPIYGNCYSFNAGWRRANNSEGIVRTAVKRTTLPGRNGGFRATLFVETDEYMPQLASSTGIRVHIHEQSKAPVPEDSGFTLATGFSAMLLMKKTIVERLGRPYHSVGCVANIVSVMLDMGLEELWPIANYSMAACMKACYQRHLTYRCACTDPRAPSSSQRNTNSSSPCSLSKHEHCRGAVELDFSSGNCSGQCPPACTDVDYRVKGTQTIWPNRDFLVLQNKHLTKYASRNEKWASLLGSGDLELIRRNLLQIEVFFEQLNYERIVEVPGYTFFAWLSNIGGAVGLFTGVSFIAVIQLFEFIGQIVKSSCQWNMR